jgi:hypothetical protein
MRQNDFDRANDMIDRIVDRIADLPGRASSEWVAPDYVTEALVKHMAEPMVEHLNALLYRQYLAELVPVRDAFQALIEHRDARRKDALRRSLTVVENEETN